MPIRRTLRPTPAADVAGETPVVRAEELTGLFAAPAWLRDLGVMSWLLVGAVAVVVGVVWLIDLTGEITIPVILGCVIGAVAVAARRRLARRGVPRGLAAAIVMLLIVAVGIGVLLLTLGGLATQASSISDAMTKAVNELDSWLKQLGVKDGTVKKELQQSIPQIGGALVGGIVTGHQGALVGRHARDVRRLHDVLRPQGRSRHAAVDQPQHGRAPLGRARSSPGTRSTRCASTSSASRSSRSSTPC